MASLLHRLAGHLLPPIIARPLARRFTGIRYTGNYATWAEAARRSTGYDTAEIHDRVAGAARRVRDGQAAFERDGVAFAEPDYRWPLLACLIIEANKLGGRLRVLDFGGSLGSSYLQHRSLLAGFRGLRWAVVEQDMFVETGRREFSDEILTFHATMEEAARDGAPDVVLFSGVLGWIEHPHAIIARALALRPAAVIIDRTPVSDSGRDVAKVQYVPAEIYRASYPCWFLGRGRLLEHFKAAYSLRAEFPSFDAPVSGAEFKGFYFVREDGKPGLA
jgi:putative methyltransferase (TIGR04325 family)